MRRITILSALFLLALPVSAVEVSSTEMNGLAERASGDPVALRDLRSITSVDGQKVDMATALDAGTHLAERLAALTMPPISVDPSPTRATVAEILAQPEYQGEATSAPTWYQRLLYRVIEWVMRLAESIGGPWVAGAIAFGLVVVTSVLVTLHLGRRRSREVETRLAIERALARGTDPGQLEQAAGRAANEGHFAEAIRLQFVAGLLRLDQSGRISFAPATPTIEYSLALASPAFERLSEDFDRVAYGGATATAGDLEDTKRWWRELLAEVKR